MSSYPSLEGQEPNARRAAPFAVGNSVALHHGGRSSSLRVSARAQEIAGELRPLVPAYKPTDEPTLLLLASKLARIELVSAWLDKNGLFDGRSRPRPANALLEQLETGASRLIDKLRLPSGHGNEEPGGALRAHLQAKYGVALEEGA